MQRFPPLAQPQPIQAAAWDLAALFAGVRPDALANPNQPLDANVIAAQINRRLGHLSLLAKLAFVVYLFAGTSDWRRNLVIWIIAIAIFGIVPSRGPIIREAYD